MPDSTTADRLRAGAVHGYTASGSVFGLLFVLAAVDGEVRTAFWWMCAALFVDGTDGLLARRFEVKRHLPGFDGALLDNIIDYLTYVFAPVVLLRVAGYLPEGLAGLAVAAVPLLASCYQFCRTDAKTEDHSFTGFPSYWNVVALYAVALDLSPAAVTAVLVVCALLVPVPVGYLYPSRTAFLPRANMALALLWGVSVLALVAGLPDPPRLLTVLSLLYIAYYVGVSVVLTLRKGRARAVAEA
jgi:phosphatidylcholine synthase